MTTNDVPLETECEDTIIKAAMILGYRVHAERPARTKKGWRTAVKGHPGWLDLVIVGHGEIFVAELKRKGNKASDDQLAWIEAWRQVEVLAQVVWVPEEQQDYIDMLAKHAQRRSIK